MIISKKLFEDDNINSQLNIVQEWKSAALPTQFFSRLNTAIANFDRIHADAH